MAEKQSPRVVPVVPMYWALVEEQREMIDSMMRRRAQERDDPERTAKQEADRREGEAG